MAQKRRLRAVTKYNRTDKGKAAVRKYQATEKGKAARKKYLASVKGKLAARKSGIKYRYGISLMQYEQLLSQQHGKCAICYCDEPSGAGQWHIDHCHETGKIRGLLCHHCNISLGGFKDSVDLLQNAINYLGGHEK